MATIQAGGVTVSNGPAPSPGGGGSTSGPGLTGNNFLDALSMATPYGAAIQVGAQALGAVMGKSNTATATSGGGGFDSSGWNVNFGGGSITSSATKADAVNWLLIGGALIALAIVVRAWKHN